MNRNLRTLYLFSVGFNLAGLALFLWMSLEYPPMALFAGFCLLWGAQATTALRGKG